MKATTAYGKSISGTRFIKISVGSILFHHFSKKRLSPLVSKFAIILLDAFLFGFSTNLVAQDKPVSAIDPYELNLSELSKLKITSASKVTQKINEISSTVFIITTTQIKENGYNGGGAKFILFVRSILSDKMFDRMMLGMMK